jgi:hypothetical protein
VRKALSAPARQIAINAGEDGSVIVGKILEKDQYAYGFDSQTGEYGNLVAKGIIDPTKVGSDNQLGELRFSHELDSPTNSKHRDKRGLGMKETHLRHLPRTVSAS